MRRHFLLRWTSPCALRHSSAPLPFVCFLSHLPIISLLCDQPWRRLQLIHFLEPIHHLQQLPHPPPPPVLSPPVVTSPDVSSPPAVSSSPIVTSPDVSSPPQSRLSPLSHLPMSHLPPQSRLLPLAHLSVRSPAVRSSTCSSLIQQPFCSLSVNYINQLDRFLTILSFGFSHIDSDNIHVYIHVYIHVSRAPAQTLYIDNTTKPASYNPGRASDRHDHSHSIALKLRSSSAYYDHIYICICPRVRNYAP